MHNKKSHRTFSYVATLSCETLMSARQAINDKLQGSVAAYLKCGGVVSSVLARRAEYMRQSHSCL